MGLFDLVEQDDLVGPAPHGFGQHPALVIADIARRRTDQAGDGVFLLELRHVEPQDGTVIIEQEFRQCLGQFGLADTGRADKQE